MKIKVFTAFSGYDSQCLALNRLREQFPEFDYELVGWSEIDKYAIQAHNALFPQWAERNYGDISKIDWSKVPDFDLFTYSSPCQDFSNAGLQKGGEEGSGTRSSLLWECRRAIVAKRPKYLLLENVAALVSQKFLPLFNKWQAELESYGYSNFAQVLNSKDYGVPQNRERIFLLSILGNASYHFPQPFNLERRQKDVLEENVDEKYYLSDKTIASFTEYCERKAAEGCGFKFEPSDGGGYAKSITTNAGGRPTDNFIRTVEKDDVFFRGSVEGTSPCITSACGAGGGMTPMLTDADLETTKTKELIEQVRGHEEMRYRIRKLTPRECFRLMGVDDKDIDTIEEAGISNSQQYKLAGNSIVVDVLYHIFRKAFCETHNENQQQTLF